MSPIDAVRSVLQQYATFTGRARRAEFWWFVLFFMLVQLATVTVDSALISAGVESIGLVNLAATFALLLPYVAVSVRRLHDTGRSGWWYLITLVPIVGAIVFLVFAAQDSVPAPNQYGPSPKQPQGWGSQPPQGWGPPQG